MPSFRRQPIDVVLDVRSRIEFWFGHLDGATCIPVDTLADTLSERAGITKDMRILVYCASGARSAVAVGVLGSLGYRRVTDGGAMATAKPGYVA